MTTKDKLIEKRIELINILDQQLNIMADYKNTDVSRYIGLFNLGKKLKSEIASLESELAKEPDINTPFFGNSGARVSIEEPEGVTAALKSLMTHDKETIARWYLDLLNRNGARGQLLRYKVWENIFGNEYDTIEAMIDGYFKYLRNQ